MMPYDSIRIDYNLHRKQMPDVPHDEGVHWEQVQSRFLASTLPLRTLYYAIGSWLGVTVGMFATALPACVLALDSRVCRVGYISGNTTTPPTTTNIAYSCEPFRSRYARTVLVLLRAFG
jgi:hypothetical protein